MATAYAAVPMNVAIVYESLTGNTKKAAELMGRELTRANVAATVFPITVTWLPDYLMGKAK